MEQKDCAFGQNILKGIDVRITACKSPCKDECQYHLAPSSIKTGTSRRQNIIK